jgi:hypothetical protein
MSSQCAAVDLSAQMQPIGFPARKERLRQNLRLVVAHHPQRAAESWPYKI